MARESVYVETHTSTLPARLMAARKAKGMSRELLAVTAEVSFTTIGRAERGNHVPDLDTLSKIARALDVPLGELVDGSAS